MSATVDQLGRAVSATGAIVAGVREDQWDDSTPCAGWTVRDLVLHLVGGVRMFVALLRDETPAGDLGDDPVAAYWLAGTDLVAAFGRPGVFDRTYRPNYGVVPGSVLLHLCITEQLVHGWDVAAATGQPADLPADLAEQELAFSIAQLGDRPRVDGPFRAARPVPEGASAVDRLAGYLGRSVPSIR
jgi:uncharacterized protein (TIGR03086 family)